MHHGNLKSKYGYSTLWVLCLNQSLPLLLKTFTWSRETWGRKNKIKRKEILRQNSVHWFLQQPQCILWAKCLRIKLPLLKHCTLSYPPGCQRDHKKQPLPVCKWGLCTQGGGHCIIGMDRGVPALWGNARKCNSRVWTTAPPASILCRFLGVQR